MNSSFYNKNVRAIDLVGFYNSTISTIYRVSTIAWRCILGVAPAYLSKLFVLSSYLRPVRVGDHFARPLVVTIRYHVLTRPINRIGPSRRLLPLSPMSFLSNF